MFSHPNTVAEVRTLQNRDLLRNAARERLASAVADEVAEFVLP